MKITVEMLRSWNACYWDDADADANMARKCEAALPATPLQIARAEWVPLADRLWVLLREPIFTPKELRLLASAFAKRVDYASAAAAAYANAAAAAAADADADAAAAYVAATAAASSAAAYANERRAQLNLVIAKLG